MRVHGTPVSRSRPGILLRAAMILRFLLSLARATVPQIDSAGCQGKTVRAAVQHVPNLLLPEFEEHHGRFGSLVFLFLFFKKKRRNKKKRKENDPRERPVYVQ